MNRDNHIFDSAAGIAALPEGDAQRVAALEHVRSCASCAKVFAEAQDVLALLDALPAPPPPSPEALQRTSRAILAELETASATLVAPAIFVVVAAIAFTLLAKHRTHEGHAWVESGFAVGLAVVSAAIASRRRGLSSGIAVATSALLVWAAASEGGMAAIVGIKCVLIEVVAAALPYAALAYVAIKRRDASGAGVYAAVASAGALAGHAALNLTCPARAGTPHLVIFHFGGVLLAAMLGALGSRPIARLAAQAR